MKKLLFLLLVPIFSLAQTAIKSDRFVINATINGLPDSTLVMYGHPGESNEVFATAYSKNGRFTLFGKVSDYDIHELSFIGQPAVVDIFSGNETINISSDVKNLTKVNVTGAAFHNDFTLYLQRFTALKNNINNLVAQANKTQAGAQRDALIQKINNSKQQVMKQVDIFLKEKPASPVTAFLVYVTSPVSDDISSVEKRYSKLKSAAKQSYYAGEIEKLIASTKVGFVGTPAVDFTQNDTANIPVKLASFKGKYVLVDFWASWCGPCRMENPNVVSAYNQYKDKNFTVLGVSLDQNKDKWLQAINADNLTWTHVSDLKYWQNAAAQLYHIGSIPANMLIDPTGKIIAKDLRGEMLQDKLKDLLK